MSYRLLLNKFAEAEYDEAYNWYLNQQVGLEERFFKAINAKFQQIVSNPEYYSIKNNSHREAIVKGFPFVIIYRIKKKENIIQVIAIHHTSRKPKNKYKR